MFYQHGDCLLFKTETIPAGAKTLKSSVLHHGATGNHHALKGSFCIKEHEGSRFVDVTKKTTLSHEEHKPITLEPGKYALKFVREKDHFNDLVRAVVD